MNVNTINLLTPTQVSNLLGITQHTLAVWRSEQRYDLPYVKVGRFVRYRMQDIEVFIESRTHRYPA